MELFVPLLQEPLELNEMVNGWSYESRKDRLYEDNWKDFLNKLDSIEQKNILTALNQLLNQLREENGGNDVES